MTGEKDAPAEMPDDLVRKVIEIVEGAVNSAIPEPWEVSARASAAILALFAPILAEKERVEKILEITRASRNRWFASVMYEKNRALAAEAALAGLRQNIVDAAVQCDDARKAQARLDRLAAAIRAEGK